MVVSLRDLATRGIVTGYWSGWWWVLLRWLSRSVLRDWYFGLDEEVHCSSTSMVLSCCFNDSEVCCSNRQACTVRTGSSRLSAVRIIIMRRNLPSKEFRSKATSAFCNTYFFISLEYRIVAFCSKDTVEQATLLSVGYKQVVVNAIVIHSRSIAQISDQYRQSLFQPRVQTYKGLTDRRPSNRGTDT